MALAELRETWECSLEWIERNGCKISGDRIIRIPLGKASILVPEFNEPYKLDRLNRNEQVGDSLIRLNRSK